MVHIHARDMEVDYPVFAAGNRSLKKALWRSATGGAVERGKDDGLVIVKALRALNFDIKKGDRVGLYGHNGAGKSTLLRVLAGGCEPLRGTLDIQGSIASMLSISLGMDNEATGYENILLRATLMGLSRKEIEDVTPEIAEFSELGGYLNMPIRTYSSGMAMRLAFAVSTTIKADIILMDEWLSVGDESFFQKAKDRLKKMLDSAHILILASHDKNLIRAQCNRLFHMEQGQITQMEDL